MTGKSLLRISATRLFVGVFLVLAIPGPVHAEKVGVAAAVNPDAFSSLAGAPQSQINIGKSIFYNERINTTGSGLVQVLLIDGSTFTVGPGSDLVIDRFVYDPKKGTGQITASFSKGVMRFVGGKLSKNDGGVTVNTPAGALAIRGGIAYVDFKSATNYAILFVFGEYLKMGGKTLFEPGFGWFVNNGVVETKKFSAADLKLILAALTNNNPNWGGDGNKSNPASTFKLVNTQSLQQLIADANTQKIVDQANKVEPTPPGGGGGGGCTDNCCTGDCGGGGEEPTPVTVRVLAGPGVYTAFPGTPNQYTTNSPEGILGGGNYGEGGTPLPAADDFIWLFGLLDGRLFGTVKGLTEASCDGDDCTIINTDPVAPDPTLNLPWFEPGDCPSGRCDITAADGATVTQEGTTTYEGYAVRKDGFFAYQLIGQEANEDDPSRLLIFGGERHAFAETPNGALYKFALTEDPGQPGAFGFFASSESSPSSQGIGYISPLLALDKGAGENGHGGVWLQTNFFIGNDQEGNPNGESFINIALGEWNETIGLTGARRGGSSIAYDQNGYPQNYSFSGDIASLAGPDSEGNSSHFMGTENPNIVIGFDSTGSHNIGRDNPLYPNDYDYDSDIEDQTGATYHVGIGSGPQETSTQTSGTMNGYAAGLAQRPSGGRPDFVANFSPSDVTLNFDATTNTVEGSFKLTQITPSLLGAAEALLQASPRFNLGFGGGERSAFIDDDTFAAIEQPGATVSETVRSGFLGLQKTTYTHDADVQAYLVSADAIKANEVLFAGEQVGDQPVQKRAFCQSCDFIKWGAWGARVTYNDHTNETVTNDIHLGWWIAGDVASKSQIPLSGEATYTGDAIGTVNSNGKQYAATGDMDMTWYFGNRSGNLRISNFDNKTFSGTMVAPGRAQFFGALSGSGVAGLANGAFVGPKVGQNGPEAPKGVIGNFGVGNNHWQATGIFGGTRP